jgi:hypothetical protein
MVEAAVKGSSSDLLSLNGNWKESRDEACCCDGLEWNLWLPRRLLALNLLPTKNIQYRRRRRRASTEVFVGFDPRWFLALRVSLYLYTVVE